MRRVSLCLLIVCLIYAASFAQTKLVGTPIVDPKTIKTSDDWAYYAYYQLKLADDFPAFDTRGQIITKAQFLARLSSGAYMPVMIKPVKGITSYQLYAIPAKGEISDLIAQLARQYAHQYKMEGRKMPQFKFVDLNGKVYTPENTKGKILVVKCWFLSCQACREEIPELNKLVARYKNRNDVLFIDLIFDRPGPVRKFFKTTAFAYNHVANQRGFIEQQLKAEIYPTHYVVNKSGHIVKMVTEASELITALDKEVSKK